MKLELGLSGTHSENGETVHPNRPVTLVQTEDNEVILSLGNLTSEHHTDSRLVIHRDERGWHIDITHQGIGEVCEILLPATGDATLEDKR